MELRRARVSASIRTEGGLLPADLLARVAAVDRDLPGLADADFGLESGDRLREAITRSWNRLVGSWAVLTAARVGATDQYDPLTTPTRERWLLPLFEELGFGRLTTSRAVEIEGTGYPISHAWEQVPIHLVGFGIELDRRTPGVRGAAGAAPHALVQEYLNRSDDALWGVVSNGRLIRLLRDSTSLTRQAFVEFDLEAIFEGELYADFALLWSVCHRTRFESPKPEECLLERWSKKAADDGTRALDKLRGGVERAIETLGVRFLAHPANGALREALRTGELDRQDYYRELLRLVYRLIFLFTAEDRRDESTGRELLLDPAAPDEAAENYRRFYSMARLRSLAGRRRGTRHPDLWVSLRRVISALGGAGAPTIGLPALGSFLLGPTACPHLDVADLRNEDLLDVVRALATIEEDRRLRLVDYRNLGAEELGGIYESLLELHPRIEVDAAPPRFSLGSTAGNERKATGSYYTPTSLITCLLDSALDPVVEEAVRGKDRDAAERAILELAVVDPAAGSGHFLVAAAHRLAKRLAAIRTGEAEPSPSAVRHALRDVIAHCIYAVDVNPMAVELCKVSLWLEALEPGRPLSFLDAHIKVGNSLLGTTPDLVATGIPDVAFEALTGDDKTVARAWRTGNKQERDGQQALFEARFEIPTDALADEARSLDALPDETPEALALKGVRHASYVASSDYRRARAALDAWCAAFVAHKTPGTPKITTAVVRAIGTNSTVVPSAVRDLVGATAAEYGFFHWPLEFPAVFQRGGFDVVVGNPPWDQIQLDPQEWFVDRAPDIAAAPTSAKRSALIGRLEQADPALWREHQAALRVNEAVQHFLHRTGRYELTARGRLNSAPLFSELMVGLLSGHGRAGVIVPTGVVTDSFTQAFFAGLVTDARLVSVYDFENRLGLFAGVHRMYRFCLLTCGASGRGAETPSFAFYLREVGDLLAEGRVFPLSAADLALMNPNTLTCPVFRTARDADLARRVYGRAPVLYRTGSHAESHPLDANPWGYRGLLMFMTNTASHLFRSKESLVNDGWAMRVNRFEREKDSYLPLYEGKMIWQFDHRYGDFKTRAADSENTQLPQVSPTQHADRDFVPLPRHWISAAEVESRLAEKSDRGWLLAFRDITNASNERTVIAAVVPRAAIANNLPVLVTNQPPHVAAAMLANLNSFVLDFLARQKISGTHLNFYLLEQLPVLTPHDYNSPAPWEPGSSIGMWIAPRVVELTVTAEDLRPFGADVGWGGPPFAWNDQRRGMLRAELDAAFFHLYGLGRGDVSYVMDTFPIVRQRDEEAHGRYRTKDLILDAYDAMDEATRDSPFVSRLAPPPGDPRVAHPPRPGEEPGEWVAWSDVINRPTTRSHDTEGRPAGVASSIATEGLPPEVHSVLSATQVRPELDPATQQTLVARSGSDGGDGRWRVETAVEPRDIVMGMRVRHRLHGVGTVLGVKSSGKGAELLVRFDFGDEKWIVFGYGVLEFDGSPWPARWPASGLRDL